MISDERDSIICIAINLLKYMSNSHCDGKIRKILNIIEDWIGIHIIYSIPDPANNNDKIIFINNSFIYRSYISYR